MKKLLYFAVGTVSRGVKALDANLAKAQAKGKEILGKPTITTPKAIKADLKTLDTKRLEIGVKAIKPTKKLAQPPKFKSGTFKI